MLRNDDFILIITGIATRTVEVNNKLNNVNKNGGFYYFFFFENS